LLHDETFTEDNRARLVKTADVFGQEVRFVDVSKSMEQMGGDIDKIGGVFSRGTLFRLLIPDLPELTNLSKIIYLDCDVVVNLDIAELWNIDISNLALAAVPDVVLVRRNRQRLRGRVRSWAMRYDAQNYFNAGVLSMNLDRIRRSHKNMPKEAETFLRRYRLCADYPDQDFLNAAFRGQILYIDERFNRITDHRNVENAILHLTGGGKRPWILHPWGPRDYLYWDCFARSEWRDQVVPAILDMYAQSEYLHLQTSDCVKFCANRLKREVVINGLLRAAKNVATCLVEIFYRMREAKGKNRRAENTKGRT
jgi:lipopolysaccharide biosynthesis glycosyltransferase